MAESWVKSLQANSFLSSRVTVNSTNTSSNYIYTSNIDGKIILSYYNGDKKIEKKIPKGKEILVGRSSACVFRILEDRHVSRIHFRIDIEDNVPYLIDLGSSYGTKLNGVEVTKAPLAPNDTIQVGDTTIFFEGLYIL